MLISFYFCTHLFFTSLLLLINGYLFIFINQLIQLVLIRSVQLLSYQNIFQIHNFFQLQFTFNGFSF